MPIGALLAAQLLGALPAPESAVLPVRVEGTGCPSSAEVERALSAVLAPAPKARERELARVEQRGKALRIELVDARANVIAERLLDAQGSRAELAQLAAIVIASWESDVHPEYVRPHSDPQSPTSEKPTAPQPPPAEKPAARVTPPADRPPHPASPPQPHVETRAGQAGKAS